MLRFDNNTGSNKRSGTIFTVLCLLPLIQNVCFNNN